jgi:hypothetical protein
MARDETLHELLTHVVNETAAICQSLSSELFGFGTPPPSEAKAPSQTQIESQKTLQTMGATST